MIGSGAVAPYETHIAVSTTSWVGARVPFKRTDILHSIATVPGLDPAHPVVANNQETGGAALQLAARADRGAARRPARRRQRHRRRAARRPRRSHRRSRTSCASPSVRLRAARASCSRRGSTASEARSDDKVVRAGWLNLSLRTDRAMLVRSVLEGVAYNSRWLLDAYEKFVRRPVPKVRILGGGAQSDLWCQIYADVLEAPGRTGGRRPSRAAARRRPVGPGLPRRAFLRRDTRARPAAATFAPSPDTGAYSGGYAEYRKLYGTLKGLYRRLNARKERP